MEIWSIVIYKTMFIVLFFTKTSIVILLNVKVTPNQCNKQGKLLHPA